MGVVGVDQVSEQDCAQVVRAVLRVDHKVLLREVGIQVATDGVEQVLVGAFKPKLVLFVGTCGAHKAGTCREFGILSPRHIHRLLHVHLDVRAVLVQDAEVARGRRVEALVDAVSGVAIGHTVVVEEDTQVRRVQRALCVRCIPTNLGLRRRQEVLTACLEDVEFTAFVTVGDLTLEVVVVTRVDAVLQARG